MAPTFWPPRREFASDGNIQSETLLFNVGAAGAKALQFSVDMLPGEENPANNAVTRMVNVESDKRRVLYVEGEPRWDYKYIRARKTTTASCSWCRCFAPPKTRSTARASRTEGTGRGISDPPEKSLRLSGARPGLG